MKDRNGNTVKVGYLVRYHYQGDAWPEHQLFKVVQINTDLEYLKDFPEDAANFDPPYAILKDMNTAETLTPPFFSHEIQRLEIEELI